MRMKGVLTRVEQKIEEWPIGSGRKKSVIWLFVRGEDKKRYVFKDPFFEPYCFFRRGVLNVDSFSKEIRSHCIETYGGQSYVKVFTNFPTEISKLRNIIESRNPSVVSVYEADVVFPLRYIIDKKIRGTVAWEFKKPGLFPLEEDLITNLRIFILDTEILAGSIICLTIWDNYEKKYFTWYFRDTPIMIEKEDDWEIDWSPTEEEMMRKVLLWITERNPDVITGYNIDWDLVGIRDRALDLQLGREWDNVCPMQGKRKEDVYHMPPPRDRKKKFRDFWVSSKHQRIPGRNIVDLLEILLKTERHHLSEFTLEYVAQNYLHPPMEKLKWKGKPTAKFLHEAWNEDPLHVLKYNKQDVLLCVELNKQQALIAFADEVRKFVGCQLDDIFSNKRIAHIELLRKTKKPLPVTKKETRGYKGAIVLLPKKGVYAWIIVMDFRSLYPSVILQLNIDPDTYISISKRKGYNLSNAFILKDPDSGSEYWFKKTPEGDLPAILKNYLAKRKDKRAEMAKARAEGNKELAAVLDAQQIALKVIANAFYGSLLYRGAPSAYQCAKAITCGAREAIKFAVKIVEGLGYQVVYGDTDSIMVASKFSSYQKVVEEADYLSERVAGEMPKFLASFGAGGKSYIVLALDKVFRSFLIDEKKKRYAGVPVTKYGEGKLEVKGFGTVRSDTSKFTGDLQRNLLKETLEKREKERIKRLAELEINSFDRRPLTEIGVPCVLTKPPEKYENNAVQVKAFHNSNKYLGTNFKVGDKPKRIYVKMIEEKVPLEIVEKIDVIAFEEDSLKLPPYLAVDYPRVVKLSVKPKIEKVLSFSGIEWKDLSLKASLLKPKKKKKSKKSKTSKKGKKNVRKLPKATTKGK